MIKQFKTKRVLQGRFYKGEEIVSRIIEFLKENSITSGLISGIEQM
jgi:predicted DNA-binding protein with PD1-like motif